MWVFLYLIQTFAHVGKSVRGAPDCALYIGDISLFDIVPQGCIGITLFVTVVSVITGIDRPLYIVLVN